MKIKKILSSIIAGALAISTLASISSFSTSAEDEVIWTGSEDLGNWGADVDLKVAGIPLAKKDGIITIEYEDKGGAQIQIINKIGDAWTWTEMEAADGNTFFDTQGGKLKIKLSESQAEQFATSKAIFLKGKNAVVTKLTYTAPGGLSGKTETIWKGSEDLGAWGKDVDLKVAGIPLAEEDGIVTILYQDKGDAQISVVNKVGDAWTWTPLIAPDGNEFFTTSGGKLQIRLTAEQATQFVTSKALYLKGQNAVVTEITYTAPGAITPDDSESDDSSEPETTGTIINIENPVTDAWKNCFPQFEIEEGKMTDDYIDAKTFTKDTAMDVTINYEWTEDGVAQEYAQVKPASTANSWESLYKLGYLNDTFAKDTNASTDGLGYKTADGQTVGYAIKSDGFFISNDPSCNQIKFTITADGVNKMIEAATAAEDAYDGIIFQISGMKVTSIELSQSGVRLASQPAPIEPIDPDSSDPAEDPTESKDPTDSEDSTDDSDSKSDVPKVDTSSSKTDNSSSKAGTTGSTTNNNDKSPNTGAAGIAIAGLALAAAAIVASKKK